MPKGIKTKTNPSKYCPKCKKEKQITHFYANDSPSYILDGKYPICKECINKELVLSPDVDVWNEDFLNKFQRILQDMNKPFIYSEYVATQNEVKDPSNRKTINGFFGTYYKNINSMNHKGETWSNSVFEQDKKNKEIPPIKNNISTNTDNTQTYEIVDNYSELDAQNKKDVIRMLGYDPFEGENNNDKKFLYNGLVDYLDDSTLEDGFKLQVCITIVKAFNQASKIDNSLATLTSDITSMSKSAGEVKTLVAAKKQIIDFINSLAKDNGISVNNNHSKGKGAGTLTGIIKNLQDVGLEKAEVNLFNIETSSGIKQVADISNSSIIDQLKFDENDYNEMLIEQRDMIRQKDDHIAHLEEENRKLKKEILLLKNGDSIE